MCREAGEKERVRAKGVCEREALNARRSILTNSDGCSVGHSAGIFLSVSSLGLSSSPAGRAKGDGYNAGGDIGGDAGGDSLMGGCARTWCTRPVNRCVTV